MNLLALDLGNRAGWALRSRGVTKSGTVSFSPRAKDGPGMRWICFRAWLSDAARDADIGAIYFEEVMAHGQGQVLAAHVYGGFLAHLQLWAEVNNIPLHGVGVGTVKRHWTGKGNARKADMVRAAKERGLNPVDDNEADALALLDYALCAEGESTPTPLEVILPIRKTPEGSVGVWIDPFSNHHQGKS